MSCAPSAPRKSPASASLRRRRLSTLGHPVAPRTRPVRAGVACPAARRTAARLSRRQPGVAFSGGLDSTALLAACTQLVRRASAAARRARQPPLQPAAAAWARHCRSTARRLGVPLTVRSVQVARPRGTSLEAAAREARYAALAALLAPGRCLLTRTPPGRPAGNPAAAAAARRGHCRSRGHARDRALRARHPRASAAGGDRTRLCPLARHAGHRLRRRPEQRAPAAGPQLPARRGAAAVRARAGRPPQPPSPAPRATRPRRSACWMRWPQPTWRRRRSARRCRRGCCARLRRTAGVNVLRYWISNAGCLAPPTRAPGADRRCLAGRAGGFAPAGELGGRERAARGAAAVAAPRTCATQYSRAGHDREPAGRGRGDLALGAEPRLSAAAGTGPPRPARGFRAARWTSMRLPPRLTVRGAPRRRAPAPGARRRTPCAQGLTAGSARTGSGARALPLLFGAGKLVAVADLWLDESVQAQPGSTRRARLIWHAPP